MAEFINIRIEATGKMQLVRAEEIKHTLKGYKFYIHRSLISGIYSKKDYSITESETGASVCSGDKDKVLNIFEGMVRKFGQKGFDEKINKTKQIISSQNTPFKKAILESSITLTKTEERDLYFALKKYKLIK